MESLLLFWVIQTPHVVRVQTTWTALQQELDSNILSPLQVILQAVDKPRNITIKSGM